MAKTHSDLIQFVSLIVIVTYAMHSDAKLQEKKSFDFEQMKRNLFTLNKTSRFENQNFTTNDKKCLTELNAIGNGLKDPWTHGLWAMKLLDSWGKIPSALLSGNIYGFGAFAECFDIKRNDELYKTKYCMGLLKFSLTNFTKQRFPIIFGLCAPAVCSMDFLQNMFETSESINGHVSVHLHEKTCQLEKNASELRALDWVTIALLVAVSILIVTSTSYDIICMMYNRNKSQLLSIFSFYTNGMKLLSYKKSKSPDKMHCLDGIRALTALGIVFGHTYALFRNMPMQNYAEMYIEFPKKYHSMIVYGGQVSVDTFFVLTGFLTSFNILKHLEKTKGKINVPLLYLHRYLRLTPLLGISVLFSMTLLRFLGNGPMWPALTEMLSHPCKKHWWSTLLYIQNYVNPTTICLPNTWYLSVDMQLFLIAPFLVYLIYRFDTKALVASVALVLACIWLTIDVHAKHGYKDLLHRFRGEAFAYAYIPTHLRYSPWLIGIIYGYFVFKIQNKSIRIPRIYNLIAWAISLATMITAIFAVYPLAQYDAQIKPMYYGLYDALSRVGWAIAMCYIIFACTHDCGGFINAFLSHPLWQPFARMSYAIYLLFFIIGPIMMGSLKESVYFTEFTVFHTFIGSYVLTVFAAIIATLAFESPIIVIEKIIFHPKNTQEPYNKNAFVKPYKSLLNVFWDPDLCILQTNYLRI